MRRFFGQRPGAGGQGEPGKFGKARRLAALALAAGLGLVAALAFAAAARGWPAVYAGFAPLCHQRVERCLVAGGAPLPLCARDLGIVLGAAAGGLACALLGGRLRAQPRLLAVAAAVLAGDVLLERAGLYGNVPAGRLAAGLFFGFALAATGLVCSPSPGRRPLVGRRRPTSDQP